MPRVSLVEHYNAIFRPRGFQLAAHHFPVCIGIEDARIQKLMWLGAPGLGKTLLYTIAVPTYAIGNDPTISVLAVSAGEDLMKDSMNACMGIIQSSPVFRKLYPTVEPDPQAGWSIERGLYVKGRPFGDPDPSYLSAGLASKRLTGKHGRLILLDDLHDKTNSQTPEGRKMVVDTYYDTLLGRGDGQGARYIMVGRRWARDDLYGHLIGEGDWVVMRLPAIREGSVALWYDVFVPRDEDGKVLACVFSETLQPAPDEEQDPKANWVKYRAYYGEDPTGQGFCWPGSPGKRAEAMAVRRSRPSEWASIYLQDPAGGGESVFRDSDFRAYAPPKDLALGMAAPDVAAFCHMGRAHVAQAWDTATGKNAGDAQSAGLTGLLVPCTHWHRGEDPAIEGRCQFHFDVYLLDFVIDHMDFAELARAIRAQARRWDPRRVLIEDRSSGIDVISVLKGSGEVPVEGIKVSEGKIERAINGIGGGAASVQGWARLGRILYPAGAAWAPSFLARVIAFSGDAHGRADEFDTLVHLVAYAIRKSGKVARLGGEPDGTETASTQASDEAEEAIAAKADFARRHGLRGLVTGLDTDPTSVARTAGVHGLCGACGRWALADNAMRCGLDRSVRIALDGCGRWQVKAA